MHYVKIPIIVYKDSEGLMTVSSLTGSSASTVGMQKDKCLKDLTRYYQFLTDLEEFQEPEFEHVELDYLFIPIRPAYRDGNRYFPSDERIEFKIPYVIGTQQDDTFVCVLPTISQSFYFWEKSTIEQQIQDRVGSALNGQSPKSLSRFLCPENIEVEVFNCRLELREKKDEDEKLHQLNAIASPLGSRLNRKLYPLAWQRAEEVRVLAENLTESQGNLLLLGESGIGKTTVLVNAIRKLGREFRERSKEDPDFPSDQARVEKRFWTTNADRIIAGMQYLGEWEERMEAAIEELASVEGVLCVESLESLIRLGGRDATDSIASFLGPFLYNNDLRMIVEATPNELDACRRLLPGFDRHFRIIEIEKFDRESAKKVLLAIGDLYRQNQKIESDIESAEYTYRLFNRFYPYDGFPGQAVRFWRGLFDDLDEKKKAAVRSRAEADDERLNARLDNNRVIRRFVKQTGLPELLICDDRTLDPDDVESYFRARIVGQDHACRQVTDVITTLKAGLNDPARPIGVQLFCGPTGVGKTEMAKSLADFMFGGGESADRLLRLDMSEYSGYGAASRLLTQNDGQPSKLIREIRKQPFSVILLDEVEKAAPEVFDVLMGVFDEGRLTDRWGRTTDFRSTLIVMTSNLGVKRSDPIGFDSSKIETYEKAIRTFFRPEFFNRIDSIIPFHALGSDSIQKITELELDQLAKREGLVGRNLKLHWTPEVVQVLARNGFNPKLGARPLQRTIEVMVVAGLARKLAENVDARDQSIKLTCDDNASVVIQFESSSH